MAKPEVSHWGGGNMPEGYKRGSSDYPARFETPYKRPEEVGESLWGERAETPEEALMRARGETEEGFELPKMAARGEEVNPGEEEEDIRGADIGVIPHHTIGKGRKMKKNKAA